MFGVKSENNPITGQFAEQFCKVLLGMEEQKNKDSQINNSKYSIVCG